MFKYYKLEKDDKDFEFNTIRFWKNKTESNDIFPCYPEQDLFEILNRENIKIVNITNNKEYIINVNNLGPEGMVEIKFHNVNKVFDYFLLQSFNDKEEDSQKNDWFFFYLDQQNFTINNLQKESCTTLFVLDQWMTFGSTFHDILKNQNPEVKFLRKFKNRFICNKNYTEPQPEEENQGE